MYDGPGENLKIQAICQDIGIPEEADFYMLLHTLIHEHDPEGEQGVHFFENKKNRKALEQIIGRIDTGPFSAKKMFELSHQLGYEWDAKRPTIQMRFMFSDPKYRAVKFSIYEEKILPLLDEYDFEDIMSAMADADEAEQKEIDKLESQFDE